MRQRGDGRRFDPSFEKEPLDNYDRRHLLPALKPLLEKGEKTELCRDVLNVDRTVGTELSGELVMKFGPRGLAEDTLTVHFTGCAGQSFGAFLAPGVTFELVGEANDFVGKGLSGGKIIVLPRIISPTYRQTTSSPETSSAMGPLPAASSFTGRPGNVSPSATAAPKWWWKASATTAVNT